MGGSGNFAAAFYSSNSLVSAVYAGSQGLSDFNPGMFVKGTFMATGTKNAVVDTTSYGKRFTYAQESSEVWFEDFGSGQLVAGETTVELDPVFLETVTIDDTHPIKVFVTLTDDCSGVYVSKDATSFTVHELGGGTSNATFDWRAVAKRKGFEDMRLEESKN